MKKKLLLGLGSLAAIVAPIASVVSCGDEEKAPTGPLTRPTKVGSSTVVVPVNLDAINIHPATAATAQTIHQVLDVAQNSVLGPIETKVHNAMNIMKTESGVKGMQKMLDAFYEMGAVTFKFNVTFHGVTNTFNVVNHMENYFDIDAVNASIKSGNAAQALNSARNALQLSAELNKNMWAGFIPTKAFTDFKAHVVAQHGNVLMYHAIPAKGGVELPLTATVAEAKANIDHMMEYALQHMPH